MKFFPLILLLLAGPRLGAATVLLTWLPSLSTNVTNYRLYAWTNCPDTNCFPANAVENVFVGNVTNATLENLLPVNYTFAATAIVTNPAIVAAESPLSNFAYLQVPFGPTYLVTVQSSTNLVDWSNTPVFFRLQIEN
jgi:hypothetical protein